jgi:hypothetical protein
MARLKPCPDESDRGDGGSLQPAACETIDKGSRLISRALTALGGALDLDRRAVDQNLGDALHQLV